VFAGYAPVLAALGSLLAKMDNFSDVVNRLKSEGRREAWSVIESVLDEILKRERTKLCDKLIKQIETPVPEEAYDRYEQLTFLTNRLHNRPLGGSARVKLPPADQAKYHAMVKQLLVDHPFVKQGRPSNAVLGSLVIAHAIVHDLLSNTDTSLLVDFSRQPFLWRFLRGEIEHSAGVLIDGRYVGYILNSYWSDPITRSPIIVINSDEVGSANVHVSTDGVKDLSFTITLPVQFYGQMRNCTVNIEGGAELVGRAANGSGSTFYVYGKTAVIAESIDVAADTLTIEEQLWMESAEIESSPRLSVHTRKDAKVGWGGVISGKYPWNALTSTLAPPYGVEPGDVLTALVYRCSLRLPDRVLVTTDDYRFSADENKWVARDFPTAFPQLLKLLIKHNLAYTETFGTYAQNKFRIHMNITWSALRDALKASSNNSQLTAFLNEARQTLAA
jgi:hypothetical protein